jgi:hypothetical protein
MEVLEHHGPLPPGASAARRQQQRIDLERPGDRALRTAEDPDPERRQPSIQPAM